MTIGWVTSTSPFYSSHLPDWKHHDVLLNRLSSKGIRIVSPLPPIGTSTMISKILSGDKSVLYHTLRSIDLEFSDKLYPVDIVAQRLDSLVLDGVSEFQEVLGYSRKDQEDYIDNLIESMLSLGKRVLLIDNDKVASRTFLEGNALERYIKKYAGDPNLYIFSPYDQEISNLDRDHFYHIYFEVSRESVKPIVSLENRGYLLRYVGNNYFKSSTHVPIFDRLSRLNLKIGINTVLVNGSAWSVEDRKNSPFVTYKPRISLSHDTMYSVYGDSILGLSGVSEKQDDTLYHLRWKEMLIAGTYIIRETSEYLDTLLDQPFNTETIKYADTKDLEEWIDSLTFSSEEYYHKVEDQRNILLDFFSLDNVYEIWKETLKIK